MNDSKVLSADEVKRQELNILLQFDSFAKENGFQYSLCGGTLLGAIRHKGFIPWDDDIDVMVPRPDYDRIIEFAKEHGSIGSFRFTGFEIDGFPMPFIKMTDSRIAVKDHATRDDIPLNLWIDIFPLDGITSQEDKFPAIYRKSYFYKALIKTGNYKFVGAGKTRAKRIARMVATPFVEVFNLNTYAEKRLIKLAKSGPHYSEAKWVGEIVWGPYGIKEYFRKSLFERTVPVEFEGHFFPALQGWDEHLRSVYGDYMKIPPENERVNHGLKAWRVGESS